MSFKKDKIFSIRFDDETFKFLRNIANHHCVSIGAVVRRIVLSYKTKNQK